METSKNGVSCALNMEFPVTLVCCDSQVKWHEICLSIPAAILEVLNAWENGVLSVEAVQVCSTEVFLLFVFLGHRNILVIFPVCQLLI